MKKRALLTRNQVPILLVARVPVQLPRARLHFKKKVAIVFVPPAFSLVLVERPNGNHFYTPESDFGLSAARALESVSCPQLVGTAVARKVFAAPGLVSCRPVDEVL